MGVLGEDGVEHGVADLVGHLVGMALGDALGGEGPTGHGWLLSPWCQVGAGGGGGCRRRRRGRRGDGPLVAAVDGDGIGVRAQQRNGVGVVAEADAGRGDVVGDDQVEALGDQLGAGVGEEVGGLGGEPDEHLARSLRRAEAGEDVRRRLEHDVGHAVVLLDLAGGRRLGPEVGDGGGHHDDVGVAARPRTAACIWAAVSTAHDAHAVRCRQVDGADEHDVGPRAAASAATA